MNHSNSEYLGSASGLVVTLDGQRVSLPATRRSLAAIRAYLETMALANQRVLGEFLVDDCAVGPAVGLDGQSFRRVDAATVSLGELPLLLLATALQEASQARASAEATLTLVLINKPSIAREMWWKLADKLKEPVITLSLMPDHLCQLWCGVTFLRLRQWQLEQISKIVRRVDEACDSQDNVKLSDAIEKSVLPWLDRLDEHIRLWRHATQAGARRQMNQEC